MGKKRARKRRTGSLREVRPGVWEISVSLGRDVSGRWKRTHRTVEGDRQAAEQTGDTSRITRELEVIALLRDEMGRRRAEPEKEKGQ